MLTKFSVTNFKGFNQEFVFNLNDARGYTFNEECVKGKIVNNSIIYGVNGVGKSNLGLAIFDIVNHLTDNESGSSFYSSYFNAYSKDSVSTFKYEFYINGVEVLYEYEKVNHDIVVAESLFINGNVLAKIDRDKSHIATINFKGAEGLKTDFKDSNLSLLKYIKNNTVLDFNEENLTFEALFKFIEGMLFFRSLNGNDYIGLENGNRKVTIDIIKKGNVKDLEKFLNKSGVDCSLTVVKESEEDVLAFDFGEKKISFLKVASQGTKALTLLYFWLQRVKQENSVSFLFIDEFDAFYHHKLAGTIVEELKMIGVQFVLTTHNTALMNNDLLRPDCFFIMKKGSIVSLPNATDKDIREVHNLEKMYKGNSFNGKRY